MAEVLVVTCPECEKKFKPKTDVRGKKIKCPFCTGPIVVPAAKNGKPATKNGKPAKSKSDAIKDAKSKPDARKEEPSPPPAPEPPPPAPADDEFDDNPNPYGVKNVDLVPRCPNCTQEMGPHDVICLSCGYNTLTREWGKTEKTMGLTGGRHLLYLLPALGSAVFGVFSVLFLIFYGTVAPYWLDNTMFWWLDSEAMRMWAMVIFLVWIFAAGMFCMKRFIEKPKPDEIQMG